MPARVPPISAGELDQRILLQKNTGGQDAVGQPIQNWVNVFGGDGLMWARARPLRGSEFFAAGATQSQETIAFGIRYRDDVPIDSAMRVVWYAQNYPLTAPPLDVEGGHHTIEFYCTGGRPG